jgi:phytol kinase
VSGAAAEGLRALAVGAAFLLVFGAAEAWRRRSAPPSEWTRKFVHVAGGALVAGFPWIFESRWSVLALATAFAALLWGTRRLGVLASVHGIRRRSQGGLYYPLAVVLLFAVAHDEPVFYLIAILALAVSDSAAALLGSTYGRRTYDVEADRRSIEGSVVFFLATFLVVHIPVLLWTDITREASLLIGFQLALLVTLFEGVSQRGSDNLIVPLVTFYLLGKLTPLPADVLLEHVLVQLALVLVVVVVARRQRLLKASGAMAAILFFYGAYLLGGWPWVAVPLLALVGFVSLRGWLRGRREGPMPTADYQVLGIFYVTAVAVAVLFTHDASRSVLPAPAWLDPHPAFFTPFVGIVAAQLGLVLSTQFEPFNVYSPRPATLALVLALAAAGLLVLAPAAFFFSGGLTLWGIGVAAAITFLAAGIYYAGRRSSLWPVDPPWNVRLQAASVAAATALVLPVHLWHLAGA